MCRVTRYFFVKRDTHLFNKLIYRLAHTLEGTQQCVCVVPFYTKDDGLYILCVLTRGTPVKVQTSTLWIAVTVCGYNTDLVHYFSRGNISQQVLPMEHGGEVKSLFKRAPDATAHCGLSAAAMQAVNAAEHSPSR